jgi:tetratricopeptide (TPR) repeat protein
MKPVRGYVARSLIVTFSLILLMACAEQDAVERGTELVAAGDLDGAIAVLREELKERPGDARTQLAYGQVLSEAGKGQLAEWALREAMNDPKWVVPAGLRVARQTAVRGNYVTALEVLDQVLEVEPENYEARLLQASAQVDSRLYPEAALETAEILRDLRPDAFDFEKPKVLALIQLDRIDEVAEELDTIGERIEEGESDDSRRAWYCTTLAIFTQESDKIPEAKKIWDDCLEQFPADYGVVRGIVSFYEKQNDFPRTVQVLRDALASIDDDALPLRDALRVSLIQRLHASGQQAEAEKILLEARESEHPAEAVSARLDLARHYDRFGQMEKAAAAAEEFLERVREIRSPQPDHVLEVADLAIRAGKLERALEIASEMTVAAHRELVEARVAQDRRDFQGALRHYREAGRLWPDNPLARYHAARAAEALGDFDLAIELYRHSTRISLQSTDARGRVALLLEAQGQPLQAVEALQQTSGKGPLAEEESLILLRLGAQGSPAMALQRILPEFIGRFPNSSGKALAAVGQGMNDRGAPGQAIAFFQQQGAVLLRPSNDAALKKLIEFAGPRHDILELVSSLQRVAEAVPSAASTHEAIGMVLESEGGSRDEIRSAYQRAIELDPERSFAIARLGLLQLEGEGDTREEGIGLLDRALEAEPLDEVTLVRAARRLIRLNRVDDAERVLTSLIDRIPYQSKAAFELGILRENRGQFDDRTVDLAKRAVRFGPGVSSLELLARVHQNRGETEKAETVMSEVEAFKKRSADEANDQD